MSDSDRIGLNKVFKAYLDEISSNEGADSFLREDGLDPEKLVEDGIRKIKQMHMNIAAEETQRYFISLQNNMLERAKAEAERLMADVSFDFQKFVKLHNINVAYRNFDELTKEEIQAFLERHLMLKLEREKNDDKSS